MMKALSAGDRASTPPPEKQPAQRWNTRTDVPLLLQRFPKRFIVLYLVIIIARALNDIIDLFICVVSL